MLGIRTTIEITGDVDKFQRAADRMRDPASFMRQVGNLGVASSVTRLDQSTSQSERRSTGLLSASLTVFEVSIDEVVIGSNLPYAAQRNFGGTIFPRKGKALAIPLDDRIIAPPSQVDPNRDILDFVPIRGGASGNVFGLLVDSEGVFSIPDTPLYALATHVDQEGAFFLGWSDDDVRAIEQNIFPRYVTEP